MRLYNIEQTLQKTKSKKQKSTKIPKRTSTYLISSGLQNNRDRQNRSLSRNNSASKRTGHRPKHKHERSKKTPIAPNNNSSSKQIGRRAQHSRRSKPGDKRSGAGHKSRATSNRAGAQSRRPVSKSKGRAGRSASSRRGQTPHKHKKKKGGKHGKKGKHGKHGKHKKHDKHGKHGKHGKHKHYKRPPTFKEQAEYMPYDIVQKQIHEVMNVKDRIAILESRFQNATKIPMKPASHQETRNFVCERGKSQRLCHQQYDYT